MEHRCEWTVESHVLRGSRSQGTYSTVSKCGKPARFSSGWIRGLVCAEHSDADSVLVQGPCGGIDF